MVMRRSTLVGVFDNRIMAEKAIEELRNAGFADSDINYSGNAPANSFMATLRKLFTGQSVTAENVASDLNDMGLSDNEAQYYAQAYESGHPIVAVNAGRHFNDALALLQSNGAHHYNTGGAMANDPNARGMQSNVAPPSMNQSDPGYVTSPSDYARSDLSQPSTYAQQEDAVRQRQNYGEQTPAYTQQRDVPGTRDRNVSDYDTQPIGQWQSNATPQPGYTSSRDASQPYNVPPTDPNLYTQPGGAAGQRGYDNAPGNYADASSYGNQVPNYENQRANYPNQPGYGSRNPNYAGQPGYGNQPGVPNPNQPGYSNQESDYPNQPGYGNQPSEQVPGQPSPSYPMPEDQGPYVDPTKSLSE